MAPDVATVIPTLFVAAVLPEGVLLPRHARLVGNPFAFFATTLKCSRKERKRIANKARMSQNENALRQDRRDKKSRSHRRHLGSHMSSVRRRNKRQERDDEEKVHIAYVGVMHVLFLVLLVRVYFLFINSSGGHCCAVNAALRSRKCWNITAAVKKAHHPVAFVLIDRCSCCDR